MDDERPAGELWEEDVTEELNKIPYRFTSKEYDEETGYYYYGARYYSGRHSRWLSADPAGGELINPMKKDEEGKLVAKQNYSIIEGLHWYSYTSNNPVKYVDPTGFDDKLPEKLIPDASKIDFHNKSFEQIQSEMPDGWEAIQVQGTEFKMGAGLVGKDGGVILQAGIVGVTFKRGSTGEEFEATFAVLTDIAAEGGGVFAGPEINVFGGVGVIKSEASNGAVIKSFERAQGATKSGCILFLGGGRTSSTSWATNFYGTSKSVGGGIFKTTSKLKKISGGN